jgi:hypothetical protein
MQSPLRNVSAILLVSPSFTSQVWQREDPDSEASFYEGKDLHTCTMGNKKSINKSVEQDGTITTGNACPLSDGASACVLTTVQVSTSFPHYMYIDGSSEAEP